MLRKLFPKCSTSKPDKFHDFRLISLILYNMAENCQSDSLLFSSKMVRKYRKGKCMFAAFREFACFAICKKSIRRQHSGNSILLGRRILLSNTGENIYERRDGRWEGRYICGRKPDGRAQYVSVYGRSCSDVRNKIRERLRACTPEPAPHSAGTSVLTVNQLFESFLSHANVKPSTYARYKTVIDLHILPKLGKRRVAGLTAKELSGYLAEKRKCGNLRTGGGAL